MPRAPVRLSTVSHLLVTIPLIAELEVWDEGCLGAAVSQNHAIGAPSGQSSNTANRLKGFLSLTKDCTYINVINHLRFLQANLSSVVGISFWVRLSSKHRNVAGSHSFLEVPSEFRHFMRRNQN